LCWYTIYYQSWAGGEAEREGADGCRQSLPAVRGVRPISQHAAVSPAGGFVLFSSLDSRVKILGVFIYCQVEPPCDSGNTCRLIKLSREEFWKVLLIQELNLGWTHAPELSVLLLDGILIIADLPSPPAFFPLSPSPNNLILAQFPSPFTLWS